MSSPLRFPTTTEVLGVFAGFDAVRPSILEAACERGTAVHTPCLARASGMFYLGVDQQLKGYFDSFCLWFDSQVETVIAVEPKLVDETHGYTGTPDLILKMRHEPENVIADLKTSKAKGKTWCGQLAAYKNLAEKNKLGPIGRVFCLRLRADGSMPIADQYDYSNHDFFAFLNALSAYRYFKM